MRAKGEDKVAEKVLEGIRHLSEHTAYLAVVTGQVDGGIDSYSEETRTYQKIWERDQSEDRRDGRSDHGGGVRDPRTGESMKSRVWNSFKIACSMYSKIPVPLQTGPKKIRLM